MGTKTENTELFTDKSESYAKYRSGYPEEMIEKIMESFRGQNEIQVADIGAGTGISSRLLGNTGAKVTAVEPNQAMAEAAEEHPNVKYVIAPAETTGLESNSFDIVSSFQAFHWFHFRESLKEFNRILKPGGKLALVWSYWDETDEFTGEYLKIIEEATNKNTEHVSPYDGFPAGFIKKWRIRFLWKFRTMPYFRNVERLRYSYVQKMDAEALIGCAHSQSYLIHEGEEWNMLCSKIEDLYDSNRSRGTDLKYKVNLFIGSPRK